MSIGERNVDVSTLDPEELNRTWEGAAPQDILRFGVESFPPGRLALVSAFGPASLVAIDLLSNVAPGLPVIFIDTLHHFPETLAHVERVRERYHLDLRVFRPAETRAAFEAEHGTRLWEHDLERYQQVAKVEPFRRATAELDAWFTGRRREQAKTRVQLPVFERGEQIRVNPLANWTRSEVWRYILEHEIPYNPLHDQGFTSIGDEPLTTPVAPGEHERAGRWRGLGKTECGIHLL